MSFDLKLDRLAIHYVDRKSAKPGFARTEKDIGKFHPAIDQFFLNIAKEIWDAPNQGSTRSAKFVEEGHPRLKPSVAREAIEQIIASTEDFFAISKSLAQHLHDNTPPQVTRASLLAIMRLTHLKENNAFVSIVKIRHDDKDFVRLLADDLTELDVETVENMLLQEIQKGACIPHPHRSDYHLKVIDKQAPTDPARYFTENFLGCLTKMSDQYQTTHLLSELERFARKEDLPLASEKLPGVIKLLQEQDNIVTTETVIDTVEQQQVFGDGFQRTALKTYVEQDSRLGPLDIPPQAFGRRGKAAKILRRLTYHFRDPELRGVTLSGPPGALERIASVDGDVITFHIETDKNGYRIRYE